MSTLLDLLVLVVFAVLIGSALSFAKLARWGFECSQTCVVADLFPFKKRGGVSEDGPTIDSSSSADDVSLKSALCTLPHRIREDEELIKSSDSGDDNDDAFFSCKSGDNCGRDRQGLGVRKFFRPS